MNIEIKDWLDGFTDHMKEMCDKFGGQSKYGREVDLSPNYISLIANRKFQDFSKKMIISCAEKSGYDTERFRYMTDLVRSVSFAEFEKTKAEASSPHKQKVKESYPYTETAAIKYEVTNPNKLSKPQDLYLIGRYVVMRNEIPLPENEHKVVRKYLLHELCKELSKLESSELC